MPKSGYRFSEDIMLKEQLTRSLYARADRRAIRPAVRVASWQTADAADQSAMNSSAV
jgi:hypothetical protein